MTADTTKPTPLDSSPPKSVAGAQPKKEIRRQSDAGPKQHVRNSSIDSSPKTSALKQRPTTINNMWLQSMLPKSPEDYSLERFKELVENIPPFSDWKKQHLQKLSPDQRKHWDWIYQQKESLSLFGSALNLDSKKRREYIEDDQLQSIQARLDRWLSQCLDKDQAALPSSWLVEWLLERGKDGFPSVQEYYLAKQAQRRGCPASLRTSRRGVTLLHAACWFGDIEFARNLLGADTQLINVPDYSFYTPLHRACRGLVLKKHRNRQLIDLLKEFGADQNAKADFKAITPEDELEFLDEEPPLSVRTASGYVLVAIAILVWVWINYFF